MMNEEHISKLREIKQMVEDETITPCLIEYKTISALEAAIWLLEAEQDGRLVELPCKVGDTVYEIDALCDDCQYHKEPNELYPFGICNLDSDKRKGACKFRIAEIIMVNRDCILLHLDSFGKTIFLPRRSRGRA